MIWNWVRKYIFHAELFVRILVKSELLSISQSELRSSFEPLLSGLEILQFGLRSCSGNSLQPSNAVVAVVVPLGPCLLHKLDSLNKPIIHFYVGFAVIQTQCLWPAWFLYHGISMLDTGWLCSSCTCMSQTGFSGQIQPIFVNSCEICEKCEICEICEVCDVCDLFQSELWSVWDVWKAVINVSNHSAGFPFVLLLIKCALREPCVDPARDRVERCHINIKNCLFIQMNVMQLVQFGRWCKSVTERDGVFWRHCGRTSGIRADKAYPPTSVWCTHVVS